MRVSRISALLITTMMIPAISGCTIQGNGSSDSASDVVHQIEDDGTVILDDDPIAVEPQLDADDLNRVTDETNEQGEIISVEPHKGSAD